MSTINCLGPDCGNHGSMRIGSTRCRVLRPTAGGPVSFGNDNALVAWTDVLLDAVSVARVGVAMAGVGTLRETTAAAVEMVTAPRVARQIIVIVMVVTLPAATRRVSGRTLNSSLILRVGSPRPPSPNPLDLRPHAQQMTGHAAPRTGRIAAYWPRKCHEFETDLDDIAMRQRRNSRAIKVDMSSAVTLHPSCRGS